MKWIAAIVMVMASLAHGAEIKVMETPVDVFRPNAKATFMINRELGRAWVELEMFDRQSGSAGEAGSFPVSVRQSVEGLKFQRDTSLVTLTLEGQEVVCASVRKRWFGDVIRNKDCALKVRQTRIVVDDGYHQYKRLYHQVFIITK